MKKEKDFSKLSFKGTSEWDKRKLDHSRTLQKIKVKVTPIVIVGCFVVLFYGISTFFGSFNAELNSKQCSLVLV